MPRKPTARQHWQCPHPDCGRVIEAFVPAKEVLCSTKPTGRSHNPRSCTLMEAPAVSRPPVPPEVTPTQGDNQKPTRLVRRRRER